MRSNGRVADGPTVFPVLTAAQNAVQLRSRLESLLNVPQRVRLRGFLRLGLAGQRFEQPSPPSNAMNTLSLLNGLRFVDSFFPSGGYAFSSGLEASVQGGAVRNAEELSTDEVRGGATGTGLRYVLIVSLAGTVVALAAIWVWVI